MPVILNMHTPKIMIRIMMNEYDVVTEQDCAGPTVAKILCPSKKAQRHRHCWQMPGAMLCRVSTSVIRVGTAAEGWKGFGARRVLKGADSTVTGDDLCDQQRSWE